jgi:hypothetical protein
MVVVLVAVVFNHGDGSAAPVCHIPPMTASRHGHLSSEPPARNQLLKRLREFQHGRDPSGTIRSGREAQMKIVMIAYSGDRRP